MLACTLPYSKNSNFSYSFVVLRQHINVLFQFEKNVVNVLEYFF